MRDNGRVHCSASCSELHVWVLLSCLAHGQTLRGVLFAFHVPPGSRRCFVSSLSCPRTLTMASLGRRCRRPLSVSLVLAATATVAAVIHSAAGGMYNFDTSKVVQLTDDNFRSMVLESKETWYVDAAAVVGVLAIHPGQSCCTPLLCLSILLDFSLVHSPDYL